MLVLWTSWRYCRRVNHASSMMRSRQHWLRNISRMPPSIWRGRSCCAEWNLILRLSLNQALQLLSSSTNSFSQPIYITALQCWWKCTFLTQQLLDARSYSCQFTSTLLQTDFKFPQALEGAAPPFMVTTSTEISTLLHIPMLFSPLSNCWWISWTFSFFSSLILGRRARTLYFVSRGSEKASRYS